MKENREDIILYHQQKRRRHKIKLAITATILIAISLMLIGLYSMFDQGSTIKYKETAKVDYSVNLKENEFYEEDKLEKGIDVIASLIEDIDVEFKYDLELDEEIEYTYSYKILAETKVKEKSKTNLIYETEEEILNKANKKGKSNKLKIDEEITINYNEYNNQINKLLDVYNLQNTSSELKYSVYLEVINSSTGEQINKENEVMSIQMPLATKTVEISVNENTKDMIGLIIMKESNFVNSGFILVIGVLLLIIGFITLVRLIKYILDTRSAEKMYDDELKKILFDYKSYVQKMTNEMDYEGYKIIRIDTFKELLEMQEEIQSPILMYTEEENRKSTFMMVNGNLLFEYILGAELIRERLIKKSKDKEKRENEKNK